MKAETLTMLQKDTGELQSILAKIDREISTLSEYLDNLSLMINELKKDRKELEIFIENPKHDTDVLSQVKNSVEISGEYFYG